MQSPSVTIVVPVCDGAPTLERLARLVRSAMLADGVPFELLFVDDASTDGSWDVIEGLHDLDGRIRAIGLEQRSGQHAALLCGLRAAANDVVVTIDDDLEHPPEEISELLALIEEGADLVYGTPRRRMGSAWRSAGALFARLLLARTVGLRVALRSSSFRAFRTSLRDTIPANVGANLCLDLYLNGAARRVVTVRVRHAKSERPRSRYGLRRLTSLALSAGGRSKATSTTDPYRIRKILPAVSYEGERPRRSI